MTDKHTHGPWDCGSFEESLGYDCMTGGLRVGPVVLDGADYGQKRCASIEPDALNQMYADARLIAAAPDLLKALELAASIIGHPDDMQSQYIMCIIAKAKGEST
ncbi:MAG: hypothetical protein KAI73_08650 [Rhodospirillaceae bacterium]|nr:hypothetical protein [Rhodospirillaceae bacterium]